jgi:membrane protease subunit HflK
MESVLSQSSKVVVDTKGNNNLLYLPLDKLMQREAGAAPRLSKPGSSYQLPQAPQQEEPRLRDDRRTREVR